MVLLDLFHNQGRGRPIGDGGGITYYVDATAGSNSNAGNSSSVPWQTIAKVNGETFYPGDKILFKRGETWSNQGLTAADSGRPGSYITYGAYGSGNDPIIIPWTAQWQTGLTITGSYILIENLRFRSADDAGIKINGNYNIVQNCEIDTAGYGVAAYGSNNLITNCYIHDIVHNLNGGGAVGVCLYNGDNEVSYNQFVNCIDSGNGNAVEVYSSDANSNYIDNLHIHHNLAVDGNNSWMEVGGESDQGIDNLRVHHNLTYNNTNVYCLVWHTSATYAITMTNCQWYNNTHVETVGDYRLFTFFDDTAPPAGEFHFKNNIVYCTGTMSDAVFSSDQFDHTHNDYYVGANTLGLTPGGTEITDDPVFATEFSDLHIQTGSPCRNIGTDVGLTLDYDDVVIPQETNPAIGAYEYVA